VARKHRVELTAAARRDVEWIYDHISQDSPESARVWVDKLEDRILSLERFPFRCRVIPEAGDLGREYRHSIPGNYRILYRVSGTAVWVVRIVHGAQLLDTTLLET